VSAVIAYQRYSAANLGLYAASTPDLSPVPGFGLDAVPYYGYEPFQESGYGTGVRLAVRQEVVTGIALDAGFQSRIDIEFAASRRVFATGGPRHTGARPGGPGPPGERAVLAEPCGRAGAVQ
jgi:hypothetical protein